MREREDSEERLSEGRDQRLSDSAIPEKQAGAKGAEPKKPAPRRNIRKNVLRVALGLLVGVAIAEGAFRVRDGGAFPHVNVYLADAELGTRLRPGATENVRFASPKNPITQLRVNSDGYRGDEWPAKSDDEIVVVGDSQVFGLGVEEGETFSKELERALTKRKYFVRNLGVPTYGPGEYNKVLAESLAKRPAKTVVWVANMANDLFEVGHPNKDRHVVWDGWAVRKEHAPQSVLGFPGRGLLFTDSHAFYALRRYAYERDADGTQDRGVPSEGTFKDIAGGAVITAREHDNEKAEAERLEKLHASQAKYARDAAEQASLAIENRIIKDANDAPPEQNPLRNADSDYQKEDFIPKEQVLQAARLSPGDIVRTSYGEEGRDVRVNAEIIRRGAAMRASLEKSLREKAEARNNKEVLGLFEKRDELAQRALEIEKERAKKPPPLSPLAKDIAAAKEICDKAGARLIVVALPIDVQVDKAEWAKYGSAPQDMEATKLLNADVVTAAEYVGAEGLDATTALAAAEPGAFLDGDIHMTPKGHKALGQALAAVLAVPHVHRPEGGLAPGRSLQPTQDEWTQDTEIAVTESDPAGCETKRVREWVGIFCHGAAKGVRVDRGREVVAGAMPGQVVLVAPIFPGQDIHATFAYAQETRGFTVKPGKDGAPPDIAFTKPEAKDDSIPGPAPESGAFCTCFESENKGKKKCGEARTAPNADCARTYGTTCASLMACATGSPIAPPTCDKLASTVGSVNACVPLCGTELPCAKGTCTKVQGGDVCL